MSTSKTKILNVLDDFKKSISSIQSLDELEALRITYLGRKGILANLMDHLKTLSIEEKREQGPQLNALKQETEALFQAKKEDLFDLHLEKEEEVFKNFDVTAYKPGHLKGSLHPYTHETKKIISIFHSMGYSFEDGPELETDFYNFESLNIPKNHPARDMQDTFWTTIPGFLLRTHTSPVQIRTMQQKKAPIRAITLGRTFRNEATDASHDFMFRQLEGIAINKNISLSQMIATMKAFLQEFFEKKDINVRARPGYFPFVEPGIEIDMACPFCKKGCSTCKHTCWIEMVGAGLIHPNVLKHGGIDPQKYTGFAFGFGVTRLVMIKYGINDIRLLHNAQVEFLKQF